MDMMNLLRERPELLKREIGVRQISIPGDGPFAFDTSGRIFVHCVYS
jgi:hypothetical protein